MLVDPELAELFDQAARNLNTLELLARSARAEDPVAFASLQSRLQELRQAYTREADALTRQVLKRAVERRVNRDRRRPPALAADASDLLP